MTKQALADDLMEIVQISAGDWFYNTSSMIELRGEKERNLEVKRYDWPKECDRLS